MVEKNIDLTRAKALYFFYFILGAILVFQLVKLQLLEGDSYAQAAKKNAQKIFTEPKSLGKILDRHSKIIVDTQPCYNLVLKAGQRSKIKHTLSFLKESKISFDEKYINKQLSTYPHWHPITLIYDADEASLAELSFHLHRYPELEIEALSRRVYRCNQSWGSVIGFLREDKIKKTYTPLSGLEKSFHETLSGQARSYEITKTARNAVRDVSLLSRGEQGADIRLSLDYNMQTLGYKLFEKYQSQGSLIALDPKTGQVLALVSAPSYEPGALIQNISSLSLDPAKPLFNRSLSGLYPPASLLKPLIALAALEEGIITKQSTIYDPGYYTLGSNSRRYKDWKSSGHGHVNVKKALRESCDTFFYDLGYKLGIDKMSHWLELFGFGQSFDSLGLPNEDGVLPSREWKMKTKNEHWYKGESLITAIGQGYLSATPIQLAHMCCFFANKGFSYKPTLLLEHPSEKDKVKIDVEKKEIWDTIHSGLIEVVNHPMGTAHRKLKKFSHLKIAGKTGTAQVVSLKNLKSQTYRKDIQDHSLFMGYAPYYEPRIVIVVISEHQPTALLIAGEFLEQALRP